MICTKMPSLEETIKKVKAARGALHKFGEDLPDLDANCYAYSIIRYAVEELDRCLKELPPAMVEAAELAKKQPDIRGKIR